MNGDKALGRLSSKHVWDVIKVDVVKVFPYFHEHGKFESLNATFITLIPKKVQGLLSHYSDEWCMIGRWIPYLLFSMLCLPLGWTGEAKITYVGFPKEDNLLRSKL